MLGEIVLSMNVHNYEAKSVTNWVKTAAAPCGIPCKISFAAFCTFEKKADFREFTTWAFCRVSLQQPYYSRPIEGNK